MFNPATLRLGLSCCITLHMVFYSLLPCPCIWAEDKAEELSRPASVEPSPVGSRRPNCTRCEHRMEQLPARSGLSNTVLRDVLIASFSFPKVQSDTGFVHSTYPLSPDLTPTPDIYEIQFLRE